MSELPQKKISQTWWSSVGSIYSVYNKLQWSVSELPEKDIANAEVSVGSSTSCGVFCLNYLKKISQNIFVVVPLYR